MGAQGINRIRVAIAVAIGVPSVGAMLMSLPNWHGMDARGRKVPAIRPAELSPQLR
jgi:hypothetical protein